MTRKTVGAQSVKARSDSHIYDPLEIGYALSDEIIENLQICAERHRNIFDEQEYFICLFIAGDPLIKGVRRHKYAAFLHLPSPRPEQSCFLFNKATGKIKRLWSLPSAVVMALISESKNVSKRWQNTKKWCDSFFRGTFWEDIRKQHNIHHLSEHEYLLAHKEEFLKAGAKEPDSSFSEPFDFSKIQIKQIIDTKTARSE